MNKIKTRSIIIALSLAGILLVLISTGLNGAGISNDAVHFISVARSLLSGEGYTFWDGSGPVVLFPPLYPVILAGIGFIGIKPIIAARFLNALLFGLIIFFSGRLFSKYLKSEKLALLGTITVLLSDPVLFVSVFAWTEPLFTLLIILFFIYLPEYLNKSKVKKLFVLSVIASLASLQKYAGASLIISGFVLIAAFMKNHSFQRRFKKAAAFGIISAVPLLIWIIRNYFTSSTLIGTRPLPDGSLSANLYQIAQVVTGWFIPHQIPFYIRLIIFGLAVSLLIGILMAGSVNDRINKPKSLMVWSAAAFILIYFLLLLITAGITEFYFPGGVYRYCEPVYVLFIFILFAKIEDALGIIEKQVKTFHYKNKARNFLVIGLCALWLIYPVARTSFSAWNLSHNSIGYYRYWKDSPLLDWLRKHTPKGRVYSNKPDVIYFFTGIPAIESLKRYESVSRFRKKISAEGDHYLVWFYGAFPNEVYSIQELCSLFPSRKLAEVPTAGEVYLFGVE